MVRPLSLGKMQRMLSMRDLKASGPARSDARGRHGTGRADARAHRAADSDETSRSSKSCIERKDRDIAWRDAKIEKITSSSRG
jgi:hypothetical protein